MLTKEWEVTTHQDVKYAYYILHSFEQFKKVIQFSVATFYMTSPDTLHVALLMLSSIIGLNYLFLSVNMER